MSNAAIIWNYLVGKGLSPDQAAGVMGNLVIESGDNPGAYNAKEGAVGIAQWEGGRRANLQQFAASRGTNEGDLQTQLDFLWSELNGPYKAVLDTIKYLPDAQSVAQEWNQQFEISADHSGDREANAANILSAFKTGGVNAVANYQGGGTTTAVPEGASSQALDVPTKLTEQQYADALGFVTQMLQSIPDLNSIVQQAMNGQWSAAKFIDEIHNTNWWKQNNDSARQLIALKFSDPAQYNTQIGNAQSQITNVAHQLGISLNANQLSSIAQQYLIGGWDSQTLQHHLASFYNTGGTPGGQAAAYYQQLSQMYADYGLPANNATLQYRTQQLLAGNLTLDTYKQSAIQAAKGMYPSLSSQLDAGLTVRDIADPYMQTMGNMLEIDPRNIGVTDPTIKRALQGTVTNDPSGKPIGYTSTTLYDFEKTLRQDPRWATTQNAKDTMSSALTTIGKNFGFLGQ